MHTVIEGRLKSKKDIDSVFEKGTAFLSTDKKIKAVCIVGNRADNKVKAAFAVSKKAGNAVWRNRAKRLMRVAFRQNSEYLNVKASKNNKSLDVVLSVFGINKTKYSKLDLTTIMLSMNDLCKRLDAALTNE